MVQTLQKGWQFRSGFDINIDAVYRDDQGRFLVIKGKLEDSAFTIVNICPPNVDRCPANSLGSRIGAVVRALAFHQCVPGSIPGLGVICGLSLLVLYSAPRGFSPGTPVFPSPQKPTFDLI